MSLSPSTSTIVASSSRALRTAAVRHASTSTLVASSSSSAPSSPSSPSDPSSSTANPRPSPSERRLPLRKQFLLDQYQQIFSSNQVIVFFEPHDFTVAELTKLRVELSTIASSPSGPSAKEINEEDVLNSRPRLVYLRPGMLPPALQKLPHIPSQQILQHIDTKGGPIAALTLKSLHPPTLKAALKAFQKLSTTPNARKQQKAAAVAAAASGGGKGKGAAAAAPAKAAGKGTEERFRVISALIESKNIATKAELDRIATLPSMEEILAQLVAVVEAPGRNVLSMVTQAGGMELVRTLEGFRVALEDKERESAGGGEPSTDTAGKA